MHGHWHKFHTTQYFWRMVHHGINYQQILSNICETHPAERIKSRNVYGGRNVYMWVYKGAQCVHMTHYFGGAGSLQLFSSHFPARRTQCVHIRMFVNFDTGHVASKTTICLAPVSWWRSADFETTSIHFLGLRPGDTSLALSWGLFRSARTSWNTFIHPPVRPSLDDALKVMHCR